MLFTTLPISKGQHNIGLQTSIFRRKHTFHRVYAFYPTFAQFSTFKSTFHLKILRSWLCHNKLNLLSDIFYKSLRGIMLKMIKQLRCIWCVSWLFFTKRDPPKKHTVCCREWGSVLQSFLLHFFLFVFSLSLISFFHVNFLNVNTDIKIRPVQSTAF